MNFIGIIVVSPLWGIISTKLFLQSWLAFIGAVINIIGIIRGKVERKITFLGLGVCIVQMILFAGLLGLGFYLLSDVFSFGYTKAENIVYWIFAAVTFIYLISQFPLKIKKAWQSVNIPGSIEMDIWIRKLTTKK